MNGFGFIEYKDAMDARDVVPGMFFAQRLLLLIFARGGVSRDNQLTIVVLI